MRFTFARYRRMCVVAVIPLLAVGFAYANYEVPYDKYLGVLCQRDSSFRYYCRGYKYDSNEYRAVVKQEKTWFDIISLPDYPNVLAMAAYDTVPNSIVQAVEGFYSDRNDKFAMNQLIGKAVVISLGFQPPEIALRSSPDYLVCGNLSYLETSGTYRALCEFGVSSGAVTFTNINNNNVLSWLNGSIGKLWHEKQVEHYEYMAIYYPIFVYLFLLLSVMVWLAAKAARYVKAAA